jgi:hypothetical protein
MMEELSSSETSIFTRTTPRNSPEDGVLHCHMLWTTSLILVWNTWNKPWSLTSDSDPHTWAFQRRECLNAELACWECSSFSKNLVTPFWSKSLPVITPAFIRADSQETLAIDNIHMRSPKRHLVIEDRKTASCSVRLQVILSEKYARRRRMALLE